ncbi:hypothetical protein PIB30_035939 [Stylosanthes scabra]|uniref:Uncharacterized protein n=1 Tax=Stylosanthes scabra TaxID=79078 RepID=A0ABU6ZA48_9FABA|nr:hypothetical protein [Stylosanthes scabra]
MRRFLLGDSSSDLGHSSDYRNAHDPSNNYEELERIHQKENQEMLEMQKQIAITLNQMAEMLQKSTCQQIQPQPQSPIPNPLPPQPLPNPKGFLNVIHDEVRSEGGFEDTDNEEAEQHLYELLLEMAGSKDRGDADSEGLMDFCEEYDSDYKEDEPDQERETENEWGKETQSNDEKLFFVNTIFDERKDEEEMPTKCEDPGACLVTCKIRGVDIHECLCDPWACRNIMPHELYETLDLGPLK